MSPIISDELRIGLSRDRVPTERVYGSYSLQGGVAAELQRRIDGSFKPTKELVGLGEEIRALKELKTKLSVLSPFLQRVLSGVSHRPENGPSVCEPGSWMARAVAAYSEWKSNWANLDSACRSTRFFGAKKDPSLAASLLPEIKATAEGRLRFFSIISPTLRELNHKTDLGYAPLEKAKGISLSAEVLAPYYLLLATLKPINDNLVRLGHRIDELLDHPLAPKTTRGPGFMTSSKSQRIKLDHLANPASFDIKELNSVIEAAQGCFDMIPTGLAALEAMIPFLERDLVHGSKKERDSLISEHRQAWIRSRDKSSSRGDSSDNFFKEIFEERVRRFESEILRQGVRKNTALGLEPSVLRIAYLLEQQTVSPTAAYREVLSAVPWPELRSSRHVASGVVESMRIAGVSEECISSLVEYAEKLGEIESSQDVSHLEVLRARILGSITPRDVAEARKNILVSVEDEGVASELLTEFPMLFAVAHSSSANRDLIGDIGFKLLVRTEEIKAERDARLRELELLVWNVVESEKLEELVSGLKSHSLLSSEGEVLLSRISSRVRANYLVTLSDAPPVKDVPRFRASAESPEELVSLRRKNLRELLQKFGFEGHVESLIGENRDILTLGLSEYQRFAGALSEALTLSQDASRPDMKLSKNVAAYSSVPALAKTIDILRKQKAFDQIIGEVETEYGDNPVYLFATLRRGFYRGSDFFIERWLPSDYIVENAFKGDVRNLVSNRDFSKSVHSALKYLHKVGACNRRVDAYNISASAIKESEGPVGKLLNFVINTLDADDDLWFKGILV